jgi:hypothetical protein
VLNALFDREDCRSALDKLVVGTVPAGSECAFAKMTTFLDPHSASWVLLKGHRVSAIDVMRITQVLCCQNRSRFIRIGFSISCP